jgi:hypothetical protein
MGRDGSEFGRKNTNEPDCETPSVMVAPPAAPDCRTIRATGWRMTSQLPQLGFVSMTLTPVSQALRA